MNQALSHIHVEGFCSLESIDLDLGPVTVLIGPNGSGKSNLLSFLRMMPLLRTASLRRFVGEMGGAASLLFYGPKVTREISFKLEFERGDFRNSYAARLGFASGDSLIFLEEEVGARGHGADEMKTFTLGAGHSESKLAESGVTYPPTEHAIRWWLARMNFFHFHDTSPQSALRTYARAEDARYLRSDGSNLAAYLAALRWGESADEQKAWRRINLWIRRVAPFIQELQPVPTENGFDDKPMPGQSVRLDWLDERGHTFGCEQLSDGTLRAIALITALAQPSARLPAFISIDEPELGLHPAALETLAALVRSVSSQCQILLATQSPALLDHFEPEEVVVAERRSGGTQLRRLDRETLSAWLSEYSLSQLYDKNLLGGRP